MIKIITLLLLTSCLSEIESPKLKVGDCASGEGWKNESGEDSSFDRRVYWKVEDVSLQYNHYVLSIHDKESNKRMGSVAQKFTIQDKLSKISCPQ